MKNNITMIMQQVIRHAETCTGNGVPYPGVPTGFKCLDKKLSGFQPGELILLAGTPGIGKTSLALNLTWNIASKTQRPVIYFSGEMKAEKLAGRIMSRVGGVNLHRLKHGSLREDDWQNLAAAFRRITSVPIHLVDEVFLDVNEVKKYAKNIKESIGDLGLIVVDWLQVLPRARKSADSVSNILKILKRVARELNVPVLVLSELNIPHENREDKRPILSDISNYAAIVPHCDVVLSVHRSGIYDDELEDNDFAQIIVQKQNNGPIGFVRLSFSGKYGRFDNVPHDYEMLQR